MTAADNSDPEEIDDLLDAMAASNADWIRDATNVLEDCCHRQATVTTDDLWPHLTWPANGRVMGKVTRAGITLRWITKWEIDRRLQTYDPVNRPHVTTLDGHVVRHARPQVIYRSLLFIPPAPPAPDAGEWHPLADSPPGSTP